MFFTWRRVFGSFSVVVLLLSSWTVLCFAKFLGYLRLFYVSYTLDYRRQLPKFLETVNRSQETITQLLTHQARTKENNAFQIDRFFIPAHKS